jgi:hypothetical protein
MATEKRGVMVYLSPELEEALDKYCADNDITRKNKEGEETYSMGTGIIHYLKSQMLGIDLSTTGSKGLSRYDLLNLVRESLTSENSADSLNVNIARINEIAQHEIEQALAPIKEELGTIQSQVAKLMAMSQDDLDPAVVQTYLTRRSEKIAAETAALRANPPVNSSKEPTSNTPQTKSHHTPYILS